MTGAPESGWNFADVWEAAAEALPDAPAQVQGKRRYSWSEVDRRANGVAHWLLDLGTERQDKVVQYLYNCPEYMESMWAMYKAGLVPVNTNYRYGPEEIVYLWENADAVATIFHGAFTDTIEGLRARVPKIKAWLWVDDGSGPCPSWATPYEDVTGAHSERVVAPWGRSGDDLYMLYTGGTTGMPKGVMWRQDDLFHILNAGAMRRVPEDGGLVAVRDELANGPGAVALPACPLMHGTGALSTIATMLGAGVVVTLEGRHFDAVELLDTVQAERVNALAIVGDAFAKPMLAALDAEPGRWDISSLALIVSSGVMWSEQTKQGLLRHHPGMLLADSLGSSEAVGMGMSVSGNASTAQTAKFSLGENARVITDDGRDVVPGSGEIGVVALRGRVPLGYYKDPEKSARTFREIDGARYSIPGDYATVEADGTLRLLGRGSVVINTGGEKVYPEEVEEAIKEHPAVADAVVVGVPDDRFGEAITAMVELRPGADVEESDIVGHVKARLSAFKAPRRVLMVATVGRAPNGKVDYQRLREDAIARVGTDER
ncbi:MAG TPA: AMP-binding protein [Acidimicrobiales bacterium]|nr:AMP-binding protein [Acidimicrobiales bacterium]